MTMLWNSLNRSKLYTTYSIPHGSVTTLIDIKVTKAAVSENGWKNSAAFKCQYNYHAKLAALFSTIFTFPVPKLKYLIQSVYNRHVSTSFRRQSHKKTYMCISRFVISIALPGHGCATRKSYDFEKNLKYSKEPDSLIIKHLTTDQSYILHRKNLITL